MRAPREPSVVGFMTLSVVGSSIVSSFNPVQATIALSLLALHLSTFDEALNSLKRGVIPTRQLVVNALPYLILGALNEACLLVVPFSILALYFALVKVTKRDEITYALGPVATTLPAIAIPLALGRWNQNTWIYWYLLTVYAVATALYVESKLPWREVRSELPLLAWLPSFAVLAFKPLSVIALIEPTFKFLNQLVKRSKVDPSRLKEFGWKEMARATFFSAVLVLSLLFA